MADLSDDIFDGEFDVAATYTPSGGSPVAVRAIFMEGSEPGRESGKGLTENIRGSQAGWCRVLIRVSEVATKPEVHSTIVDDNSITWDIVSAELTRAGTWRCNAKHSVQARRRR